MPLRDMKSATNPLFGLLLRWWECIARLKNREFGKDAGIKNLQATCGLLSDALNSVGHAS
jgi:hypothetical protein